MQSMAPPSPSHQFSFWVSVAFSVNYIMGCGFLGIPEAFVKAGVLLGPVVVLIAFFAMNASKDYTLEAMGRAEAMVKIVKITERRLHDADAEGAIITPSMTDYIVSSLRKFEITDMFAIFVGRKARIVYALVLGVYQYGGLLSYATVWASSFAANVPIVFLAGGATCNVEDGGCADQFHVWLAVFAVIAVPLACLDLEEQVPVQLIMFAARILVVVLLCGTVLAGYGCDGVVFAEIPPGKPPVTPLASADGLGVIIPIVIYAFIFHHSIPVLSQPVANKLSLRNVFLAAFLVVTIAYAAIGIVVSTAFGPEVNSQCNLNWRQYVGCMALPPGYSRDAAAAAGVQADSMGSGGSAAAVVARSLLQLLLRGGVGALPRALPSAPACLSPSSWDASCIDWGSRPVYATAISFVVLIFPALDVLSAFPLNAITLGNTLMSACLGEAALAPPTPAEEAEYALTAAPLTGLAALLVPAALRRGGSGEAGVQLLPALPLAAGGKGAGSEGDALGDDSSAVGDVGEDSSLLLSAPTKRQRPGGRGVTWRGGVPATAAGGVAALKTVGGRSSEVELDNSPSPLTEAESGTSASAAAGTTAAGSAPSASDDGGEGGEDADNAAAAALLSRVAGGAPKPWYLRTRRGHRATKILFRLSAAVPPVVLTFFMLPLGTILQLTGTVGVAIAFVIPALLQLYSSAKLRALLIAVSRSVLPQAGLVTEAEVDASAAPVIPVGSPDRPTTSGSGACLSLGSPREPLLPEATTTHHASFVLPAAPHASSVNRTSGASPGDEEAGVTRTPPPIHVTDYVFSALLSLQRISMREALTRVPALDALLKTPYSPWAARFRLPEVMLVLSVSMLVYVLVDTVLQIAGVVGT